jgi:hypothetical protein
MRRLTMAIFLVALAGCQSATIGPRGYKHLLSRNMDAPVGVDCIAAWVEPDSGLARDMATAEPPVKCSNNMSDGYKTGAMLRVGHTYEENRLGWSETNGPGLMAELVLYDVPAAQMTPDALDEPGAIGWSMLPDARGTASPLAVPERTVVGGHTLRLFASAMPWPSAFGGLVCVAALDVTTRLTWTRICRPTGPDAIAETAARIVADDVPAVRIWPLTTWQPAP